MRLDTCEQKLQKLRACLAKYIKAENVNLVKQLLIRCKAVIILLKMYYMS